MEEQEAGKDKEQGLEKASASEAEGQVLAKLDSLLKGEVRMEPEFFEKDDDANGHIDWIWAMSNLRGQVYKLAGMDKIDVKLKAGRIVPAMATTTAVVAAYQTLQFLMVLRHEIDQPKQITCRNIFLNLAVPIGQVAEPGPPQGKDFMGHQVTVWDRWEVSLPNSATLADLF
jgi:hypothetical protein